MSDNLEFECSLTLWRQCAAAAPVLKWELDTIAPVIVRNFIKSPAVKIARQMRKSGRDIWPAFLQTTLDGFFEAVVRDWLRVSWTDSEYSESPSVGSSEAA